MLAKCAYFGPLGIAVISSALTVVWAAPARPNAYTTGKPKDEESPSSGNSRSQGNEENSNNTSSEPGQPFFFVSLVVLICVSVYVVWDRWRLRKKREEFNEKPKSYDKHGSNSNSSSQSDDDSEDDSDDDSETDDADKEKDVRTHSPRSRSNNPHRTPGSRLGGNKESDRGSSRGQEQYSGRSRSRDNEAGHGGEEIPRRSRHTAGEGHGSAEDSVSGSPHRWGYQENERRRGSSPPPTGRADSAHPKATTGSKHPQNQNEPATVSMRYVRPGGHLGRPTERVDRVVLRSPGQRS